MIGHYLHCIIVMMFVLLTWMILNVLMSRILFRILFKYREEACLKDSNFQNDQHIAAGKIVSLQDTFSYSGKPLARAFLLETCRNEKELQSNNDHQNSYSLEYLRKNWKRRLCRNGKTRMEFALASHESLF